MWNSYQYLSDSQDVRNIDTLLYMLNIFDFFVLCMAAILNLCSGGGTGRGEGM